MSHHKYNILIVEDNRTITRLLIKHLTESKYSVNTSESLTGARRLLKRKYFDLIILDVQLPDGNGLDLLEQIRKDNKLSDIKVIVLTKNTRVDDRVLSFKVGADDYVPKPFYPAELIARVERQLNINDEKSDEIKYKGLKLNRYVNTLEYKETLVDLTKMEVYFIEFLILFPNIKDREKMRMFMNTKLQKRLSDKSINTCATRLRIKIEKEYEVDIFKSRYGQGYYIDL